MPNHRLALFGREKDLSSVPAPGLRPGRTGAAYFSGGRNRNVNYRRKDDMMMVDDHGDRAVLVSEEQDAAVGFEQAVGKHSD